MKKLILTVCLSVISVLSFAQSQYHSSLIKGYGLNSNSGYGYGLNRNGSSFGGSSGYGSTHDVRSYTRRDGTYVQGHRAGNPGSGVHCRNNVCY